MPFSIVAAELLLAAELYLSLGWSVIPVYGDSDPTQPKVAAIYWTVHQSRRASLTQAHHWFVEQGFQGIGIVTGHISNLIVLDFDNAELFQTFRQQYPHLVEREVIQTRRGYHIYFQIPPTLHVSTRKGQGIDLLSEGCYAVARPTTIEGIPYKLIVGGAPNLLNDHDLACITRFFDQYAPLKEAKQALPPTRSSSPDSSTLKATDLQAFYRAQVGQGRGRNQALFNVTLTARDHGWSQTRVQTALADLHAQMPAMGLLHHSETERQRQREALHTIRSAFSRPARPPQAIETKRQQLPTRTREALYALKLTCAIRLIEGLREKGVQPGQLFTRKQAILLLKGIVGRDSIDHALNASAPNGKALFERGKPSREPSLASNDAADENPQTETKKCFFSRVKKSGQLRTGPKLRYNVMPTNTELCRKLGVRSAASDPMQPDDLTSAKKTRQASHRALILRRPGQYPRSWLAKRLGVSIRTIQNYDPELHIWVQPIYGERSISWSGLNDIPDFSIDGTFLEDENGKRYPAQREIAIRLLGKGHSLTCKRQEANFYSLDPPNITYLQVWKFQQARQAQQLQIEQRIAVEQGRVEVLSPSPSRPAAKPRSGLPPPNASMPQGICAPIARKSRQKPAPRLSKRRARQPLPNAHMETLAQRIHNVINCRTSDPQKHISQANARRCVVTYGVTAVENALKRLTSRSHIANPAGFFVTVLRSEYKKSNFQ